MRIYLGTSGLRNTLREYLESEAFLVDLKNFDGFFFFFENSKL